MKNNRIPSMSSMNTPHSAIPVRLGYFIVLTILSLISAHAEIINGVDFTTVYNGNVLPAAATPAWTSSTGGGAIVTPNSPSAGIFTINTSVSASAVAYYTINNTSIWNATTNSTLETSMKVDSIVSGSGVLAASQIYFTNGTKDFRIYFTPTSVLIGTPSGTQGHAVGAYATYNMDTANSLHTYRFVLSSGSLSLYIDNSQTAAVSGYMGTAADSSDLIYWGDSSGGSIGGKTEWDYLAFTNQGAFIPVPEPNAFVLAAAGILGIAFVGSKKFFSHVKRVE